ncbi:MAG: NAD(P)-binding protein [Pseudomonadota bacterium]
MTKTTTFATEPSRAGEAASKTADGRIHTLIIGAGPSGLATALKLAETGVMPLIVEKSDTVGGLMRSIPHGNYIVDIGRKELYTRVPEIDRLWQDLLGDDYREYNHRVGSLYRGRILELSTRHRGPLRGLPLPWLISGGADLAWWWLKSMFSAPANYQDYWYGRAGRHFARLFAQGYWEKFRGQAWVDMPVPESEIDGSSVSSYSFNAIRQGLKLASQGGPYLQTQWRHPARGTGQIFERIQELLRDKGISIAFETEVTAIRVLDDQVVEVSTSGPAGAETLRPQQVVSSMQIERLAAMVDGGVATPDTPDELPAGAKQSVVLVYLFIDEPCRFPHAWLEVNDTDTSCGRIVNYAAFNGDMVPPGKTCLCVEYFCIGDDPITQLSPEDVTALAIKECLDHQLVDPTKIEDTMVKTMNRTNAAASWRDWQNARKMELLQEVSRVTNLFHVNRPGVDAATFAGMVAAESIVQESREAFDQGASPTRKGSDLAFDKAS